MNLLTSDWTKLTEVFVQDSASFPHLSKWLFADRQLARGQRTEMSFYEPLGPDQILRYFNYLKGFKLDTTALPPKARDLVDLAYSRDRKMLEELGLYSPSLDKHLLAISAYNATDYWFFTQVPQITGDPVQSVLDFGAGHGRQANLLLAPQLQSVPRSLVSVDGIVGSYVTAYNYYLAIGNEVQETLLAANRETTNLTAEPSKVLHIPTWRLNQIQDQSIDLIICVQVLREISVETLDFVLQQFQRIVKKNGFIYIRDHVDRHNPNGANQSEYLMRYGFELEWSPKFIDKPDNGLNNHRIHGLPRIWRLTNEV